MASHRRPAAGRPRGFTLVELLVVIALISLLLALLMPALQKAREMGKRSACAANIRSIVLAAQVYAHDYVTFPYNKPPPNTTPLTYVHYQTAANTGTNVGVGLLVSSGAMANSNTIFCPGFDPSQASRTGTKTSWATVRSRLTNTDGSPYTGGNDYYATYCAHFCPIDSTGANTAGQLLKPVDAQEKSPCLVAENVADSGKPSGYLDPNIHWGEGMNIGMHDGSARWLPKNDVKTVSPGIYKYDAVDASSFGNIWYYTQRYER